MSARTHRAGPIGATACGAVRAVAGARLDPGFHADLVARNREVTIPHGIGMLHHAGNLRNLQRLTGEHDGPFAGPKFADSDVFKTLEAVAWELGRGEHPELRAFYDDTVELLVAAQRADGYLDSAYQLGEPFGEPWSDFVHGHELYCLGHLVQAAIAGVRGVGDERLLGVAGRWVNHVTLRFGGAGDVEYCGHPEVETALVELSRLTGDPGPQALAEAFVRRRGSGFIGEGVFGAQYYQDDQPVVDTAIMRGHAVRALYLNAGVADLVLETGDRALRAALERQWDDLVGRRMYFTGGTGSRHRDEAFGDAYELPSDRAYAETCAGIALVHWAWRMFLVSGRADHLDVLERTLYNVVLAGISRAGDAFFYSNPLQLRSDHGASQEEATGARLAWYWCACCPPNLMRLIASLEHLLFARRGDELLVANYGNATVPIGDGGGTVTMSTDFPLDGRLVFTVSGDPGTTSLAVRVPDWAVGTPQVRIDGVPYTVSIEDGWLRTSLVASSRIEVDLAMEAATWRANAAVDAVRGSVAVTRGPLVYCADQGDNAVDVERIVVASDARVRVLDAHVHGMAPLLELDVRQLATAPTAGPLYEPADGPGPATTAADEPLVLRPYATWGDGAASAAMKVWLPGVGAPR